jgi:glutamyl-tRNA reductase
VNVLLLGMNHRTAGVEVRERFAVDDPAPYLTKLVSSEEIEEAVLVSTCNRVEVVALARDLEAGLLRLRSFFRRELGGENPAPIDDSLYEYTGSVAMQHVLRVTSSIDSLVVGESQILGQMKDAYRAAVSCDACGPILTRLFQRAFATAKRVRTETRIAERPVSVARVAVDLARHIFEDLSDKTALLVGAGDMIELALEALRGEGLASVRVANRTAARAAELAVRFDATSHGLDELPELLAASDVVLTCIASERPILTHPLLESALHARRHHPMFMIDIGVPRNVDSEVNRFENVYLYDLDDLSGVAEANAEERRQDTARAEAIVLEEHQRFDGWLAALAAVPTIRHLRSRAEAIRMRELERALGRLAIDERQRAGVDALTKAIVNKILHAPLSRLRDATDREQGLADLEAARALFALDDPSAPGAEADGHATGPGAEADDDSDAE